MGLYCDRCGSKEDVHSWTFPTYAYMKNKHLCDKCFKEFQEWLYGEKTDSGDYSGGDSDVVNINYPSRGKSC